MDYTKLVKRLRTDAVLTVMPLCDDLADAADAIENISKAYQMMAEAYEAEVTKQDWIPVTERLPKDGVFVLVCNDDGHMMIAKHESETYEWYYKYTNYDFDIWDNEEQGPVCYWMPLPEPPKEET